MAVQKESSDVDVLIVGSGPAGMMASMYLSELKISHRIIDLRGTRTLNGRSDGFQIRTAEIWHSFDILKKLHEHGAPYGELVQWSFTEDDKNGIVRTQRGDTLGMSGSWVQPTGCMHQGFIEAAFGDAVRARGGPSVERGARPISLTIQDSCNDNLEAYPVVVEVQHSRLDELPPLRTGAHTKQQDGSLKAERGFIDCFGSDPQEIVQHVSGKEGTTEIVRAKYLLGCDGAHSWVRKQLPGFRMEGDNTDAVFGVIDLIPISNFPDIRKLCSIQAKKGFCLVMPRELGLVRFYVQFGQNYDARQEKDDRTRVEDILDAAREIFAPYTLDYKYCDWWAVYHIGQRVCTKASHQERVFLAGDAIHTHSPKGGQGMNVSQQDTYNLTWKIASVIRGQVYPDVLQTYEHERLPVAHKLIALDRFMTAVLTARENRDEAKLEQMHKKLAASDGTSEHYEASKLVAADGDNADQQAATGIKLGISFSNANVYTQSIGVPQNSQALLKSNGSWRLLVFAGDVSQKSQLAKVNSLGDSIADLASRYPSTSASQSNWLEVLLFHAASIAEVEITDFHQTYFPHDETTGGRKYYQIFGDHPAEGKAGDAGGAHTFYGVDSTKGALVLVRPDQFVSWVGTLDDLARLEEWLARVMVPKSDATKRDAAQEKQTTTVLSHL